MGRVRSVIVMVCALSFLAACAPAPVPPADMPEPTGTAAAAIEVQPDPTSPGPTQVPTAMAPLPEWMGIPLTDVVTGQQFRLSDFRGKVLLIEPMAVWCTKCQVLQREISGVRAQLGETSADLVIISLDVDPYEDAEYLNAYVGQSGHDWLFAIAPVELSRALEATYGSQFLNPPSTPLLVIDRSGSAQLLPYGPKTAADVLAALQPLLAAGS